jgi:hypothetical protein
MIATAALVRKLIMFLPSFHYCISVEFPVNPCIGNTPPPDIGTLLCFRLRAGPKLANVFWRGSGSTFWSVSSDLTQDRWRRGVLRDLGELIPAIGA